MASDWEEVKRLAADFQRAQLSSTTQKLSERNCVEIVKRLIESRLINVIFTVDGKEYITPKQLQQEILDELYVAGGRINLVTLSQNLNVDLTHIEQQCGVLRSERPDLEIVLGQLLNRSYLDSIAEEVDEKLQRVGELSFADITKTYDLPAEYIERVLTSRIGRIIRGQKEPNEGRTLFTDGFVTRHRCLLRGVLTAATKPIQVGQLLNAYHVPSSVVFGVIEDLIKSGRVKGTLSGGRTERAFYVPSIYAQCQTDWVENTYRQNGYLDFDALKRLGIPDPKAYVKRQFKDETFVTVPSGVVGVGLVSQVEALVEDCVTTGGWCDVTMSLPSQFSEKDCQSIVDEVLRKRKNVQPLGGVHVVSSALIEACAKHFEPLMATKAQEDLAKGLLHFDIVSPASGVTGKGQLKAQSGLSVASSAPGADEDSNKKDERRKKAAGGKQGGGTQGRETKTKSVKQKKGNARGRRGNQSDDEDSDSGATTAKSGKTAQLPDATFYTPQELCNELKKSLLKDAPDELCEAMADIIYGSLSRKYQDVAKNVYLSSSGASSANRRKTHAELQEKLTVLLANIQQFEKGLQLFEGDLQQQLTKYLQKTLCADVVNLMLVYLVQEHNIGGAEASENMTPEARQKVVQKLPSNIKEVMTKLNQTLSGNSKVEDFLREVDVALGPGICDMILRLDKKKDRLTMSTHRQNLLSQLESASDPALVLHLAVLVVLQTQMQRMVHASGKFVPQIISFLRKQSNIAPHTFTLFHDAQELVMRSLSTQDEEEKKKIAEELEVLCPQLKELGATYKRQSISEG